LNFDVECGQILSNILKSSTTLEILTLSGMGIDDSITQHLVQGMAHNTTLRTLNLRGHLTDSGANLIVQLLDTNCSLIRTNVQGGNLATASLLRKKTLINIKISEAQCWPQAHFQLSPAHRTLVNEICYCCNDIPLEILSIIVKNSLILELKHQQHFRPT